MPQIFSTAMYEVSDLQKRRAENIIWNAAQNHSFTPDFKAYDSDAKADLYWNTIIGAVRKHFDYPKIEEVFYGFQAEEDSDVYEGLLWLGLENAVFEKERETRPVLTSLRHDYAERYLSQLLTTHDLPFYDMLALAHYRRVLGLENKLDPYTENLLEELEFTKEMSTDEIVARAKDLFQRWFQLHLKEQKTEKKKRRVPFGIHKGKIKKGRYRRFGIGFADHPSNIYGGQRVALQNNDEQRISSLSAAELRAFMEAKYGISAFDKRQLAEMERTVCTGNHAATHILITKGEKGSAKIQNGFEALQREREAKQVMSNRKYFTDHISERRTSIGRLSGKIQNSVLLHLQPSPVRSNSGILEGGRSWRPVHLGDNRVFLREEQSDMGDLSVDILLDASTSQKYRQEIVSNQGVIIAESLDRCNIPCRVMSFCSMTGYTILRIFRDYQERGANNRIFEYVSNGCNRDGLGIRIAHYLMQKERYEHKILIVLSDAKPNDVVKLLQKDNGEYINYEARQAILDTAFEVRSARTDGISVICVFTGDDEDIPSAKLIYGREFARIKTFDKMADTVGKLLQNQIKNM